MTVLEDILSQEIIQKLGWTLLHFVWQAAVIALLLAILLRLLRKSAANLRYIIACLALVLIVLLPVITIKLVPVSVPPLSTYIEPAPAPAVLSIEEMPPAETTIVEEPVQLDSVAPISADSWKQRTIETLEPALPYIVSGWLVGVFGLSIWHLGGWAQLQRLRRKMVKQVDDTLGSTLKVLAEKLRVNRTVQLMESALVQIPTVVGWLRPVILLPASALTGLTSEQLEAILAHELAHIKRFDYLINMLQTVVEILGFYHPAVWWVSHKIRAERENCCDDLAVSISGDRVCYARALTSMEEIRAGRGQLVRSGGLAVAATGGNLLGRIRRLVGKDAAEKTSFSWIPAVIAVLLIVALAIPTTLALTSPKSQNTDVQVEDAGNQRKVTEQTNYVRLVLGDEGKITFQGQYLDDINDLSSILANLPNPNNIVLEWAFAPGTMPEPKSMAWLGIAYGLSDIENLVDKYGLKSLVFAGEQLLGSKGDTFKNLFRGTFALDKEIPVDIQFSDGLVKCQSIKFGKVKNELKASLLIGVTSYPKTKWEFRIELHDADSEESLVLYQTFENSGIIERLPLVSKETIQFSQDKFADLSDIDTFELKVRHIRDVRTDVSAEDDILLGTLKVKDSSEASIPILLPTITKSSVLSAKDKAHVHVDCLIVEVSLDSKMDRESTIMAENLLGNKISLRDTKVDVLLRKAAGATAATKDKSAENKRVTQDQFKALTDMLTSRGYMKILMNPRIQVINGQTAKISSSQHVPLQVITKTIPGAAGLTTIVSTETEYIDVVDSLEITPHVFADGHIILEVKAVLGSQFIPQGKEQTPIISRREVSTRVRISPGESLIIGGTKRTEKSNVKDSKEQTKEVLFILTPTIITPATDSQEKTDVRVKVKSALSTEKLKQLGLAVAMYADDHDDNLPDSLKELKPYVANDQDFQWIVNNVEYLGKDKNYQPNQPRIPVAYDKTQIDEQSGTDVLFLDGHVEFVPLAKLKKLLGVEKRFESAKKLSNLGKALLIYANDHEDKYPDSLHHLTGYLNVTDYLNVEELTWILANVEYLATGKMLADRSDTVLAYDKKLLAKGKGTNVLYNDFHVGFEKVEKLKKLGISAAQILIETKILSVSEDFLKDIGLDANSVSSSDVWSEHLVADSAAEPNSETYSLILDKLHISFLLRALGAHKDAQVLSSPQVLCLEGKTAQISIVTEEYPVLDYNEPNDASEKPQQKIDYVEIGTHIWLKPELTPDNENVRLDFKLEIRQLLGYEERKYKGKFVYIIPLTEVVSTQMQLVVPDGKTLLIGGLKKIEQVESRAGAPILSKLPLIGRLFRSRDKIKEQRLLLILLKPTINPQQKASKILRGEEDSEEHIKSLARQLEKKLNPPAEQK